MPAERGPPAHLTYDRQHPLFVHQREGAKKQINEGETATTVKNPFYAGGTQNRSVVVLSEMDLLYLPQSLFFATGSEQKKKRCKTCQRAYLYILWDTRSAYAIQTVQLAETPQGIASTVSEQPCLHIYFAKFDAQAVRGGRSVPPLSFNVF